MTTNRSRHLQLVPDSSPNGAPDSQETGRTRRWLYANWLSVLAVTGTVAVLGVGIVRNALPGSSKSPNKSVPTLADVMATPPDAATPTLSVEQLRKWPIQQWVIAGEDAAKGADAIGVGVDPQVYIGPDSNATTAGNLSAEIAAQDPNGFIHSGQRFKVPVINPNAPPDAPK